MKLFNVTVKFAKTGRDRKWSCFRYAVIAETAEAAEQKVRTEELSYTSRKIMDVYASEIEGGCMGRDNYLSDNGNPFTRETKDELTAKNPLFAD